MVVFGDVSCVGGSKATDVGDLQCVDCPSCLDCELGGNATLQPGCVAAHNPLTGSSPGQLSNSHFSSDYSLNVRRWAFYGQGVAHRCPVLAGCKGPALMSKEVARSAWLPEENGFFTATALDSQCTTGYAGIICGECADGYNHLKVGRPCDPCDDGVVNVPLLLGMICGGGVVGGVVISGAINTLADCEAKLHLFILHPFMGA